MRLTGQATTAIGNAIVNLDTHSDYVVTYKRSINAILVLGDDILFAQKQKPNVNQLKKDCRCMHNMVTK
jgi:hypothetical protein